MTTRSSWARALGALVAVAFMLQLAAPIAFAAQGADRLERQLLDGLARRVRAVLTTVCERLSTMNGEVARFLGELETLRDDAERLRARKDGLLSRLFGRA